MIPIYICDDNLAFLRSFAEMVKNHILLENYDMCLQFYTDDPYELLLRIKQEQTTGIYFLDIDLQTDITGLTLAQEIRKLDPRGYILFVTTHGEMTLLTFEYKVEAMDYIIKDAGDLPGRVATCLAQVNERHSAASANKPAFSMQVGDKMIVEDYANIFLFEVSATVHKVIMVAENRQIEFYSSLANVEKRLDSRFVRCSDSLIVNAEKIYEVDKKSRTATLTNGEVCAVSVRSLNRIALAVANRS